MPLSDLPNIAEIVVPVHKEEVMISRRVVAGDVVRVSTVTEEHEHVVDEPVYRDRVEIEHVAIGREIETVPDITQDGDVTIIPVIEEVLVVQRRLVLKEELHVRRVRDTSQHHEVVMLREQKAVVTRIPSESVRDAPTLDASVTPDSPLHDDSVMNKGD